MHDKPVALVTRARQRNRPRNSQEPRCARSNGGLTRSGSAHPLRTSAILQNTCAYKLQVNCPLSVELRGFEPLTPCMPSVTSVISAVRQVLGTVAIPRNLSARVRGRPPKLAPDGAPYDDDPISDAGNALRSICGASPAARTVAKCDEGSVSAKASLKGNGDQGAKGRYRSCPSNCPCSIKTG
jgi:hypothetical protein